jgi:hypothetical protein
LIKRAMRIVRIRRCASLDISIVTTSLDLEMTTPQDIRHDRSADG